MLSLEPIMGQSLGAAAHRVRWLEVVGPDTRVKFWGSKGRPRHPGLREPRLDRPVFCGYPNTIA